MSEATSSSNHIGTTIPPLADALTGFKSETLKKCPFCGNPARLTLLDDEGFVIDYDVIDSDCYNARRDEDGNADPNDLIKFAKETNVLGEMVYCYAVHCEVCSASTSRMDIEDAISDWNRRAYPIEEWRSAFAPSEGIQ